MKTEEELDEAIETACNAVSEFGDNTDFSQTQSIEIFTCVGNYCAERARTIQGDMEDA